MCIIDNRKAFFDYHIEERYEAGLVLEGWEVKALRAGRSQIREGYVIVKNDEIFLIGTHISPLPEASTHIQPDPVRTRKLLLHRDEIKKLIGKVEQRGYTLVPLNFHYKGGRVKCEIGLAKGKKLHDKRETEKKRDWEREKARIMRDGARS
ncbi:MAG: SsrA-binding protein SmpB [Burkholderia sp.]